MSKNKKKKSNLNSRYIDLSGWQYIGDASAWDNIKPPSATHTSKPDAVNHPVHYTSDPSGVECIEIVRHRNYNVGNAIKYLWRAGLKESVGKSTLDKQVEDLKKAIFYINDEIKRLEYEDGDPLNG